MRLFVALPVSITGYESLKTRVVESLSPHVQSSGLRWIREENLHVTLVFIGEEQKPEPARDALYGALSGSTLYRPLSLDCVRIDGIAPFPSAKRARVIAAHIAGLPPELLTFREELVARLTAAGVAFDQKKFRPHLTLAYLKGKRGSPDRADRSLTDVSFAGIKESSRIRLDQPLLLKSELLPGGARYTPL